MSTEIMVDFIEHYKKKHSCDEENYYWNIVSLIQYLADKERYEDIKLVCDNFEWTNADFTNHTSGHNEVIGLGLFSFLLEKTTPSYILIRLFDNIPTNLLICGNSGWFEFFLEKLWFMRGQGNEDMVLLNKVLKIRPDILLEPFRSNGVEFANIFVYFCSTRCDIESSTSDIYYHIYFKYILVFFARQWRAIKEVNTMAKSENMSYSFVPCFEKVLPFISNPAHGLKDYSCNAGEFANYLRFCYSVICRAGEFEYSRFVLTKKELADEIKYMLDFLPPSLLTKRITFHETNFTFLDLIESIHTLEFRGSSDEGNIVQTCKILNYI